MDKADIAARLRSILDNANRRHAASYQLAAETIDALEDLLTDVEADRALARLHREEREVYGTRDFTAYPPLAAFTDTSAPEIATCCPCDRCNGQGMSTYGHRSVKSDWPAPGGIANGTVTAHNAR